MRGIKEFLMPGSTDEALKMLDEKKGTALVLGGGTHLSLVKKSNYETVIDIKRIGLNYIKEDSDYIRIGATTRAVEVLKAKELYDFAKGILVHAAYKIGSPLTQNLVTVGGNIYSLFPWSNLPPALLVLGARVQISSVKGYRVVDLGELLAANPRKYIENNEIISEVLIPKSSKNLKTAYKVFSITENDYDMAIVAVSLDLDGKVCKQAKIAVGAAVSPCSLAPEAEAILNGKELTPELIKQASEKVVSSLKIVKDFRTTEEQLSEAVKVLVRRALEECSA